LSRIQDGRAAQELGVRSSEIRRLAMSNQTLRDLVHERIDDRNELAQANIEGDLMSDDWRRRQAASFFVLRNSVRAKLLGWVTASTTVDVDVDAGFEPAQPVTYNVRWGGPPQPTETIERDGRTLELPVYPKQGAVVEGEEETTALVGLNTAPAGVDVLHELEPESEACTVDDISADPI
jgi:hypothetical protein